MADAAAATERVMRLFEELPRLLEIDEDLVRRGRFLSTDMELGVAGSRLALSIERGRIVEMRRGPFLMRSCVFSLSAAPEVWLALLEPVPAPLQHDVLALAKRGLLRIEGNLQLFMANLQFVKDLVTLPRRLVTSSRM